MRAICPASAYISRSNRPLTIRPRKSSRGWISLKKSSSSLRSMLYSLPILSVGLTFKWSGRSLTRLASFSLNHGAVATCLRTPAITSWLVSVPCFRASEGPRSGERLDQGCAHQPGQLVLCDLLGGHLWRKVPQDTRARSVFASVVPVLGSADLRAGRRRGVP